MTDRILVVGGGGGYGSNGDESADTGGSGGKGGASIGGSGTPAPATARQVAAVEAERNTTAEREALAEAVPEVQASPDRWAQAATAALAVYQTPMVPEAEEAAEGIMAAAVAAQAVRVVLLLRRLRSGWRRRRRFVIHRIQRHKVPRLARLEDQSPRRLRPRGLQLGIKSATR